MAKRLLCALLAMLMLTTLFTSACAAGIDARIGWNTKIYQKPSSSAATISVPSGLKVSITGMNGSWAQVMRDGVTAYIPLKYLLLENRLLGHNRSNVTLYSSASTSSAKKGVIGANTDIYVINRTGSFYLVQNTDASIQGYVLASGIYPGKASAKPASQPENSEPQAEQPKVIVMDWYEGGSDVFRKNTYANIYDIESGETIRFKRMGGTNHADIEPATAADTAKLLEICGGEFSWDSRAVILYAGDLRIACAINTMPHGQQTITDNNYEGQCCLHMINSRTHGSDSVNAEHQKAIQKAYQWGNR